MIAETLILLALAAPQETTPVAPAAGPFVGSLPALPPAPAGEKPAAEEADAEQEPVSGAEGVIPASDVRSGPGVPPPIPTATQEKSPAKQMPKQASPNGPKRGPVSPVRPPAVRQDPSAVEADVVPDVAEILDQQFVGTSTTDAMENDVDRLRRTLDALVGEGDAASEILSHLEEDDTDLEGLGISPERAESIRALSNDVNSLRAQLQLLYMQGRSQSSPDEELRDVKELLAEVAKSTESSAPKPEAAPTPVTGAATDAKAGARKSRFPQKEALLAFRAGDDEAVVQLLAPLDRARLKPEVLYAFGCALVNRRELAEARVVLSLITEYEKRSSLRFATERQLQRIEHLKNGIVSLDPLLKEGRDQ